LKHIILHIDGASRGNPGKAGIGFVIFEQRQKELPGDLNVLEEGYEYIGETTNNIAEYTALIKGLKRCLLYKPSKLEIKSDSELLVRQILGTYKVRNPNLAELHKESLKYLSTLKGRWKVEHIKREFNKIADKLANKGIDSYFS
jgi:ribonuclease HI